MAKVKRQVNDIVGDPMHPHPDLINEAVRRIVTNVHPLRIILFGSAARGAMSADSDLDFLVIMPKDSNRLAVTQKIHRQLRGLPCAKDIIVALPQDIELLADNPYRVIHTALSEGREVYHAA